MTSEDNSLGNIEISPNAIATIASRAVNQSYGVVGMAARNVMDGIASTLTHDPRKGIDVRAHSDASVSIDLYVILEYGTNLASVSKTVANQVRYNVENIAGVPVEQVNVHIQGLRISED